MEKEIIQKNTILKLLILEDSLRDKELITELLTEAGFQLDVTHAEVMSTFVEALNKSRYDVIISNYALQGFNAVGALELSRKICPEVPFVCVSGSIGEEKAIDLLKMGAVDYVLKDRPERLPHAIQRALDEAKEKAALMKAERELLDSEARFRQIAETAQEWIWEVDTEGLYTYSSPMVESLLGFTPDELVGKKYFYDFFLPEEKEKLKSTALELFSKKEIFRNYENTNLHKNGQKVILSTSWSPIFDEYGNLKGYCGVDEDITERRKSEKAVRESETKFRNLFYNHAAVKMIIDPENGNIVEANKAAASFYGWPVETLKNMNIGQINVLPEEDFEREVKRVLSSKKFHFEFRHRKADGNLVDVEVFGSVIENENKELLHSIIYDISEKKKAERALLELNKELEKRVELRTEQLSEVNKELEAFTYSISHDLRGPLRAINGYTEILMEDYADLLPESAKKICFVIRNNAIKMGALISDLLKLSRMSKSELLFSDVDMNALADAVYEEITSADQRKRISFFHDNLENCHGDWTLLKQALVNLISNAVKYTGKVENPVIEMKSEIVDENIIYTIIDNGAGFDMDHYNMLFGVFQRLHPESEYEGTGVGLAIVHRIISRHRGKVWAEGSVGKGAKFFFSIPIAQKLMV